MKDSNPAVPNLLHKRAVTLLQSRPFISPLEKDTERT